MAPVRILSEYRPDEDWEDFADRLERYFIANKMAAVNDADQRRAILPTMCGNSTCVLMKDLISSDKQKHKTYDELVEIVAKHDKPTPG